MRAWLAGILLAMLLSSACGEPHVPPSSWELCARSMRLVPVERRGLPWERHLRYLEGSGEFDQSNYVIVNLSTSRTYRWGWLGNYDGRARFGVSTWWAWRNPSWKQDRWLLLYDCGDPTAAGDIHPVHELLPSPSVDVLPDGGAVPHRSL